MGDDPAIAVSSWGFMLRQAEVARLAQLLGDPDHPTVLVAGEAGVGKSRLTEHVLQRHLLGGAPGRRCVASSSLTDVPFGALVGLVPARHMAAVAAGTQQLSVFSMVREHILESGATDQRPFVICVDDLHHLDDASCGLLVQLTANAPVQLLATYRTGEPLPDGALPLWTASSAVRLDIAPFDRHDTDEIVQRIMGTTTPEVNEALWQQSRGNALYLRELIVGSVAARRILMHAGTWVLAQPLVGSTHLGEYLLQRVRRLDAAARRLADMLALCQPLPLTMFTTDELVSLGQLINAGVVATTGHPALADARLAHPIYAEVIRAHVSAVGERSLLAEAVARIQAHRQPGDDLRVIVWQLDAGESPPLDDLVRAARAAMAGRDMLLACRLTRAAQIISPRHPAASLVLSDALYEMGEFTASANEATGALGVATDPDEQASLVASLYRTYMWGLDDADGAVAIIEFAQAVTPPGPAHVQLGIAVANALTFSDRPEEALARLPIVTDEIDEFDRDLLHTVEDAALIQLGRTADAVRRPIVGRADALQLVVRSFGLTEHGSFDEAAEMAEALRADVIGLSRTLDQMWGALNAGRAHLLAGRPRTAALWAGDAMITAERAGLITGQSLITSVMAAAHAQLGDQAATAAADQRAAELSGVRGFLRAERFVGRAWAAYVANEHTRARQLLLDGAAMAQAAGQVMSESFLLHEHIRLGGEPAAERLAELAAGSQSPLVAARAAHAAALADRDATALAAAAEMFLALGARLAAAEAYAGAATLAAGSSRQVATYSSLAEKYREQCEGAVTPLLEQHRDSRSAVALSRREQEIAALAVSGLTARDIGERLFLSARTVENHLQRVYTKLGVANRQALIAYFARD